MSEPPLVLASASPRRVELLRAAGFRVEVAPAGIDETAWNGETPESYVARLAAAKSGVASAGRPGHYVVGADTVVVADGRQLGKPADAAAAATMLGALAGRTHDVLTGVSVRRGAAQAAAVEVTRVRFAALSAAEIDAYVASGEPDGKAGAYAIQGRASRFVEWIEGSYTNVVGLPVATVYRLLKELGYPSTLAP